MLLRSGEIDQRGAVVLRFEQAHVHLHAVLQEEADLVFAVRQHLLDLRVGQDVLRERFNSSAPVCLLAARA